MPDATTPAEVRQQVQDVQQAMDLFKPAYVFPVRIDFRRRDPYELAEPVNYNNGIVNVDLEQGFKWDGASIPYWLPVIPWLANLVLLQVYDGVAMWIITAILLAYTIRLLPYMQKMGRHVRAGGVHDKLYKAQKVVRLVADAIFLSILESDGVPYDVRWLMYRRVRNFGWIAWRRNAKLLHVKAAAGKDVEVQQP